MPNVTIIKPVVTEEENERRKQVLYEILTRIAYKCREEEEEKE